MIRDTVLLQLLLLVLILRQSAAASDQCSELQGKISRLENALHNTVTQIHNYEIKAGNCHELLTQQIRLSQNTEALIINLTKKLEAKEVLKANNETQTEMQTAIDGLTKAVDSLNQKADLESGKCKAVQTAMDGLTKRVELMNQSSQVLCRSEKNVHLTDQMCVSQNASRELQEAEAVINDLKKQLEAKEEALKNNSEKQVQLQTAIDSLTKTVESLNQTAALLCENPENPQTTIDGLKKTLDSLNQTSQVLCGTQKDVCQALLDAVKSGDVDSTKKWVACDSSDKCTDDDEDRSTPLTFAASKGDLAVVQGLLEGGANVDRADAQRRTGLHLAAWNGHLEVCRLLLDRGAKVNSLDMWKATPLHDAAWPGHLSIVKLLVQRGADLSLKNNNGFTPIDAARGDGKKDVLEWLQSASRFERH